MSPLFTRLASLSVLIGALRAAEPEAGAPVVAFPGAEGAGMLTTGGRGGAIYRVTNLNATGPGSLADAVSGPNRIVVFDVSGIIDLSAGPGGKKKNARKIEVAHPNITIAGQAAPGEGICIKGGSLDIAADNVIVRYLRSRRGFVSEGDSGDAIETKPKATGTVTVATGQTDAAFDKRKAKKLARGKDIYEFGDMKNVVIDHCSTSWATDENLSVTHVDRSTISWSIAAEGCDYANPKQTPPNHSEGSLWGSGAADGRSTMHHMLYAHNRLRNPRTTGAADQPPVLTFYNNVVYDWSEYASHTGSERVLLNWLNSYYKPGPSTPAEIRTHYFEFHGDPGARIFAHGNVVDGAPEIAANNKLGISHNEKFRKTPAADREAMKVNAAFGEVPSGLSTAQQAYEDVLADAGATLPARDSVDLRIVNSVRTGIGRIIEKETDLPERDRWPDYRSLPPPKDSDGDGLPDFWEQQWGLNVNDPADSAKIAAGGYANIEHYFNNTDPTGGSAAIVFVSAAVSRAIASQQQSGVWKITRTGSTAAPLTVAYRLTGDAEAGKDFAPIEGKVIILAGQRSATVQVTPSSAARDDRTAVLRIESGNERYRIGCPSASLVVIRK